MTILDAIGKIDSLSHNTYSQTDKIGWLSQLDATVKQLVIDTHEGGEAVEFTGYSGCTPMTPVLLVPSPWDEMYIRWLEAQMHYHDGEIELYNSAISLFNTVFDGYRNWYNQKHMPLGKPFRFF